MKHIKLFEENWKDVVDKMLSDYDPESGFYDGTMWINDWIRINVGFDKTKSVDLEADDYTKQHVQLWCSVVFKSSYVFNKFKKNIDDIEQKFKSDVENAGLIYSGITLEPKTNQIIFSFKEVAGKKVKQYTV